jgi:serine phosphatase RsbU (regulator of sigma subunit)
MAVLVRTKGNNQGRWVFSLGDRCVLGRNPDCDIADIFTGKNGVSRNHAALERVEGGYVVEDAGSRNGTFLNGSRVTERTPLRNGDRLVIADVELTYLETDSSDVAPPVPPKPDTDSVSFTESAGAPGPLSTRAVPEPGGALSPAGYTAEKLRALVQMLKCLGRSLDVDSTLHELLGGLFAIFPQAQSGFVAFTVPGQEDVTPRATRFRRDEPNQRVGLSRTIIRHVISRREAVLWADEDPSGIVSGTLKDLQIRSLMCAPLLDSDDQPIGIVQVDTFKRHMAFTPEDLEVMVGAVSQASIAVRFAKLHEQALHRQAVARDLDLARRVQLGLLPEAYPDCDGYDFFAYYRAAHEVGGDYYDFITLPNGRLALVVADVAGKGVSAALMMAKLAGELKYLLSFESPAAALARMNDSLCGGDMGRFVTLLVAVVEPRSSVMTIVNAGHLAPLRRRRDGSVEIVGEAERGMALGLVPDHAYQELRVAIEPGDLWLAYTDGVTDAMSRGGQTYGSARLRERLAAAHEPIRECGDQIMREVMTFLGDQQQNDDMCLVAWGPLAGPIERPPAERRAFSSATTIGI